MNGPTQANRYQHRSVKAGFTIRGIDVARFLVILLLALDIALATTIIFSRTGLPGYRRQNLQVRKMENALIKLRTDNQKLFNLIQSIKTNPAAQERLVRRQLGWVGRNEMIFESPDHIEGGGGGSIRPFDFPK